MVRVPKKIQWRRFSLKNVEIFDGLLKTIEINNGPFKPIGISYILCNTWTFFDGHNHQSQSLLRI